MKTLIEAKKFTAWYDSAEDRLRLAVNIDNPKARVDFWITRRLLLTMIAQLEDFIELDSVEEKDIDNLIERGSRKQEESIKDSSNSSNDKDGDSIQNSDEEIDYPISLLKSININWDKKSNRVSLTLISDSCEAEATLDIVAMNALIKMLLIQAPTIEWGVSSLMLRR